MNTTLRRLLPVLAVFTAAPALACGGPDVSSTQMKLMLLTLVSAPALGALLVDRGAFALAAFSRGLKRKHRPTILGPVLALAALFVAVGGLGTNDVDLAVAGLALVPVATVVCGLSFVRSVIIEQRGQPRAQLLRAGAVVAFSVLALVPFFWH